MSKKSAIVRCMFTSEWIAPDGKTIYYHELEFGNGDIGKIGKRKKMPPEISVGSIVEYTMVGDKIKIERDNYLTSITDAQQKKYGQSKGFKKAQPTDFLGFVFSYSKDIICAKIAKGEKIEDPAEEIIKITDVLYEHVNFILNKPNPQQTEINQFQQPNE